MLSIVFAGFTFPSGFVLYGLVTVVYVLLWVFFWLVPISSALFLGRVEYEIVFYFIVNSFCVVSREEWAVKASKEILENKENL